MAVNLLHESPMSNAINTQRGFRFDPTINLGHILTFIGFLITCAMMYASIDKRVVVLEEARITQAVVDRRQEEALSESRKTVREDLRSIDTKLDRLIERTEVKR